MSHPSVKGALDRAGLNLSAALPRERYDALVPAPWRAAALLPAARVAWVAASGGGALWEAFRAAPEARDESDPLDAYTARVLAEAVAGLEAWGRCARALLAFEQRGGVFADFVALGRAAGLGAPSRLGLLVHPEYGPWMSIRGVLLSDEPVPTAAPLEGFDPCPDCAAPCARACHGAALLPGGFDVPRCAATRAVEPACALRCDARRACPLGVRHAYPPAAEAHHMRTSGA